jgi:hypothetical protein
MFGFMNQEKRSALKLEGDLNETQRIMISNLVVRMLLKTPMFWIVVVALALVGFFGGGAWLNQRFDHQLADLDKRTTNRLAEVNAQIERMFSSPEINRIVEDVASKRAANLLEKGIQPKLDQLNKFVEEALRSPKIRITAPSSTHGREGYLLNFSIKPAENKMFTREFPIEVHLKEGESEILKIDSPSGLTVINAGTAAQLTIYPLNPGDIDLSIVVSKPTEITISSPLMEIPVSFKVPLP